MFFNFCFISLLYCNRSSVFINLCIFIRFGINRYIIMTRAVLSTICSSIDGAGGAGGGGGVFCCVICANSSTSLLFCLVLNVSTYLEPWLLCSKAGSTGAIAKNQAYLKENTFTAFNICFL